MCAEASHTLSKVERHVIYYFGWIMEYDQNLFWTTRLPNDFSIYEELRLWHLWEPHSSKFKALRVKL